MILYRDVEPREGEPRQPNKAYSGLLGLVREDVAPLTRL